MGRKRGCAAFEVIVVTFGSEVGAPLAGGSTGLRW